MYHKRCAVAEGGNGFQNWECAETAKGYSYLYIISSIDCLLLGRDERCYNPDVTIAYRWSAAAAYHAAQLESPKRSTVALGKFIRKYLDREPASVIDVGCGTGANLHWLRDCFGDARLVGLDINDVFCRDLEGIEFVQQENCAVSELGTFDVGLSIQCLSWLDAYERPIQAMFKSCRQWMFITSLFTDSRVDSINRVTQYDEDFRADSGSPYFYNVYSIERFRRFCLANGAKEIMAQDFEIDIDIPKPEHGLMGTYTVRAEDGRRLQISGPLFMPWKMVAVRI